MEIKQGLPAVIWPDSRVLILGSLPGDESIRLGQYYSHPRNQFWTILGRLFGEDVPSGYDQKLEFLRRHGLAIWDVAHNAVRAGSKDEAIRNAEPNDFPKLFRKHRQLQIVAFNGSKAKKMFLQLAWGRLPADTKANLRFLELASSSPAPGRYVRPFEEKAEGWRALKTDYRRHRT